MRKRFLLTVIAVIASGTFFSCAYEEVLNNTPSLPEKKTEVKFSSKIITSGHYNSRIIGNTWESGDAIGIYMLEKESLAVFDRMSNVRHETKKKGDIVNFIATGNSIYFPDGGERVRFMSYYPYKESTKGAIYKIDVSNQSSQSSLDFIYSFDTSASYDKNIEVEKVPMEFSHQLAKIIINVKNGEGLNGSDLMNMKVYISGLNTNADFNLLTGKINNYSGISPIFPSIFIAGKGNVYSGEAIVIPSSNLSDAKIVIDLNNGKKNKKSDVYTWSLGGLIEKRKKYTYNVTVNSTGISVNSTIYNWQNVDTE